MTDGTVHIPHWSPGDCTGRIVLATGEVVACLGHRATVPRLGHEPQHENIGLTWSSDRPGAYDVRPDEHEPCDDCNGWPNSFIDATGETPVPASCYPCDGDGLRHDHWCGCNPPLSMLGVGSVLVDPNGREWIIVDLTDSGRLEVTDRVDRPLRYLSPNRVSREGGWWVARWVPPTDSRLL